MFKLEEKLLLATFEGGEGRDDMGRNGVLGCVE